MAPQWSILVVVFSFSTFFWESQWDTLNIVVEVAMNKAANGRQRPEQPENVNFEPIIRDLGTLSKMF